MATSAGAGSYPSASGVNARLRWRQALAIGWQERAGRNRLTEADPALGMPSDFGTSNPPHEAEDEHGAFEQAPSKQAEKCGAL
jgi:hypothetical protein